jgi:UDP-N-acetylmuramoyl-L-alanyl-D-glutamate--2,6-diaminopimelate ligase
MTMVGRFQLQKLLRQMADAGCDYAVVETSSEGIEQYRHHGIEYDFAIFLNLTPEHIESHGSFDNYKKAKGKLFDSLKKEIHFQRYSYNIKLTQQKIREMGLPEILASRLESGV